MSRIDPRHIRLKRAYDPAASSDGLRVLVDRLWPRGLRKAEAAIDHWMKDLAPSGELRRWFGHRPDRWLDFQHRYREELSGRSGELTHLRDLARKDHVTLLFAAKDEVHNNAVVLRAVLLETE